MRRRIALTALALTALLATAAPPAYAASTTSGDGGAAPSGTRGLALYDVPAPRTGLTTLAAGNCGVRTDLPHASYTTSAQIHTRVESFCTTGIVSSNSVSATTYRSRWYGWESRGSASAGPRVTQNLRITVAINCEPGTWHRYRTTSRGVAVINGTTYTAASYEENDSEIQCKA